MFWTNIHNTRFGKRLFFHTQHCQHKQNIQGPSSVQTDRQNFPKPSQKHRQMKQKTQMFPLFCSSFFLVMICLFFWVKSKIKSQYIGGNSTITTTTTLSTPTKQSLQFYTRRQHETNQTLIDFDVIPSQGDVLVLVPSRDPTTADEITSATAEIRSVFFVSNFWCWFLSFFCFVFSFHSFWDEFVEKNFLTLCKTKKNKTHDTKQQKKKKKRSKNSQKQKTGFCKMAQWFSKKRYLLEERQQFTSLKTLMLKLLLFLNMTTKTQIKCQVFFFCFVFCFVSFLDGVVCLFVLFFCCWILPNSRAFATRGSVSHFLKMFVFLFPVLWKLLFLVCFVLSKKEEMAIKRATRSLSAFPQINPVNQSLWVTWSSEQQQQHNNTTTQQQKQQQHTNTTTRQYNNTTTQQHSNTTKQHNNTQHNNTATQQQQQHSNTTQQHNNTTATTTQQQQHNHNNNPTTQQYNNTTTNNTTTQHYNNHKHNNTTKQQQQRHNNTTIQQHNNNNNTTIQQHNNTTTNNTTTTTTTIQQHNNTTIQQHKNTTTQQYNNTTKQQHNNTTTQRHKQYNNTTIQQQQQQQQQHNNTNQQQQYTHTHRLRRKKYSLSNGAVSWVT